MNISDDVLSDDGAASPGSIDEECNNIVLKSFIDTFKTLPVLWNVSHFNYKNKYKRNEALDRLLTIQKQWKPDASREDVRKKINSLRSNFRKELKKIETSKQFGIGSNEVYYPKSWTFKALLFLLKAEKCNRNSYSSPKEMYSSDSTKNKPTTSAGFSSLNPEDIETPPRQKKKKIISEKKADILGKVCELLSQTQKQEQASPVMDPLAILWTQKLQTLISTQRILAEKAINDILFEAQFNNLHRDSIQMNISPNISMPSTAEVGPRRNFAPLQTISVVRCQFSNNDNKL